MPRVQWLPCFFPLGIPREVLPKGQRRGGDVSGLVHYPLGIPNLAGESAPIPGVSKIHGFCFIVAADPKS